MGPPFVAQGSTLGDLLDDHRCGETNGGNREIVGDLDLREHEHQVEKQLDERGTLILR